MEWRSLYLQTLTDLLFCFYAAFLFCHCCQYFRIIIEFPFLSFRCYFHLIYVRTAQEMQCGDILSAVLLQFLLPLRSFLQMICILPQLIRSLSLTCTTTITTFVQVCVRQLRKATRPAAKSHGGFLFSVSLLSLNLLQKYDHLPLHRPIPRFGVV